MQRKAKNVKNYTNVAKNVTNVVKSLTKYIRTFIIFVLSD